MHTRVSSCILTRPNLLSPIRPINPSHRLQQELELQQHSLSLLSERMAGSEGHQLAQGLADTQAALQEAQAAAAAAAEKKKEMVALAKVRVCERERGSV